MIRRDNGQLEHDSTHTRSSILALIVAAKEYAVEAAGLAINSAAPTFILGIIPR